MTTRAASAAISRRVKQELVNLLFKSDYGGKGRNAHRKLDFASYTYVDLRNAYLKRIKSIHPDRIMHQSNPISTGDSDFSNASVIHSSKLDLDITKDDKNKITNTKKKNHEEFVELQEAWDAYEKIAKAMQKGKSESDIRGVQENFTLFGVGCSFSDSVEESYRRAEIMDQAGKGWCSAGQISESSFSETKDDCGTIPMTSKKDTISLIDDEMFEIDSGSCTNYENTGQNTKRRSLIDPVILMK